MLSEQEMAKSARMVGALTVFVKATAPTVTTDALKTMCYVASNPGLTVSEISRGLGQPVTTTSQHLLSLSVKRRVQKDLEQEIKDGFDLVEGITDPMDRRLRRYWLTGRGAGVLRNLIEGMSK